MAQFINSKESLVVDSIDGLLRSSGGADLARLDAYPGIKVVLRAKRDPKKVAILAGGGSGHEPAHAGFVGPGMLTGAICGEVFASPTVDAAFAAIMAATGDAGCLLIFKNYTGDRLNFGLGAERARALGKKVNIVIVKDDIALPGIAQPRGIAGVVFAEKIAGHYAEKGASLEKVTEMAQMAADATVSLGIALASCTLPGIGREDRIPQGKAELGLGIHGEPGIDVVKFHNAAKTADQLMDRLFKAVKPAKSYALLINNLGSATPLEMGLIANEVLKGPHGKKIKYVCGPAALVTSLDMHGFSLSLMPILPGFEAALTSPAGPLVWPGMRKNIPIKLVKPTRHLGNKAAKPSANAALRKLVEQACGVLIDAEDRLNKLDAKVGDGDTGSTLATAARDLRKALPKMPLARLDTFLSATSETMTRGMGGSSGVLLGILFAAAGRSAKSGTSWQQALVDGLDTMKEMGGAKVGSRTMVDALEPALRLLRDGKTLDAAAKAARKGADSTARMTRALAGRSTHVSQAKLKGVSDPGAEAVALLFEGMAKNK